MYKSGIYDTKPAISVQQNLLHGVSIETRVQPIDW